MHKLGWAAIVEGDPLDVADWEDALKPPFDPWVEKYGTETILRSKIFDGLPTGADVYNRALSYVERLNGVLALSHRSEPVTLKGVVQIRPKGQEDRILRPGTGRARGRGHARAQSASTGPDGKPLPAPPSQAQRWSAIAETDDLLDDALMYFAKGPNWFDIYKALECLEEKVGGPKKFLALRWEPKIELLRQTANWSRHARRKKKNKPPEKPMPIREARALLSRLIVRALTEEA